MRRQNKHIESRQRIESIISRAKVCRLAMTDGLQPYIVPLCFGYESGVLYFHCASEGKKLDILRKNNRICFEIDIDCAPVPAPEPCSWGMAYQSVIGSGRVKFINDSKEKASALRTIAKNYAGEGLEMPSGGIRAMVVFSVNIKEMTGMKSGIS